MTRDDIRPEGRRRTLECRDAGQGPGDRIAIAAALEAYVGAPARIDARSVPRSGGRVSYFV